MPIAKKFGASTLQFSAVAGRTYRIAVDGYSAATGGVTLNWQPGGLAYGVSTFAGNPPGDVDGPRTSARFYEPQAVAVDGAGNIYIADTVNHTIRKVDAAGTATTVAGLSGLSRLMRMAMAATSALTIPRGIACDSFGNVFVADSANHVIRMITPSGQVTTIAGSPGLAGSTDGVAAAARFSYPSGITMVSGDPYVADTGNHTDSQNHVGGPGFHDCRAARELLGAWTEPEVRRGSANHVRSWMANAGEVYVADTGNHTIRKISPVGAVVTLAGTAGVPGSANGFGNLARFNSPSGITADSFGNLYVTDSNNHTVRKILPDGFVATHAGSPASTGTNDGGGTQARFNYPRGIAIGAGSRPVRRRQL